MIHQGGLKEPFELRTRDAVIPGAGSGRLAVTGGRRGCAGKGFTGRSDSAGVG